MPMNDQEKQSVDYSELRLPDDSVFSPESSGAKTIAAKTVLLIGLVLVLLAILAGLLWWGYQLQQPASPTTSIERPTAEENNEPESTTAEAQTDTANVLSSSDELDAIENDLAGTKTLDFTTEFNTIRAELE